MVWFLILIRNEFHGSFLIPFPVKKIMKIFHDMQRGGSISATIG